MSKVTIFLNDDCYMINTGVTQIIFDETNKFFSENELESENLDDLFHYLHDWLVVGTINLDNLSINELKIFYEHCQQAIYNYPTTLDAKSKQKETLNYILKVWNDLLLLIHKRLTS